MLLTKNEAEDGEEEVRDLLGAISFLRKKDAIILRKESYPLWLLGRTHWSTPCNELYGSFYICDSPERPAIFFQKCFMMIYTAFPFISCFVSAIYQHCLVHIHSWAVSSRT